MTNFFDWELIDLRGKSSGQIKTKCPMCIDRRTNKRDKSLSVNISKGVANCHYCGMTSARQEPDKVEYIPPRQDWKNYTALSDGMVKYLEGRKISQATAIEMRITEEKQYQPQAGKEVNNLVFNYFEGDKLVNKKYRSGAKHFTQTTGGKPIFYNINSIIGQKEAYIVEGEMDALTLHEIKVKNVISVPNGANDNDNYWINSERYISDVQKFYICTDNDTKGNDLAEKIAQRLGRWKCVRVNFQGKDANEDLQNGVLEQSIKNVSKYPISGTLLAEDLRDGMEGIYNNGLPSTVSPRHERWGPLKDVFSTMMGHLMVCTGIPSHGKSNMIEDYVLTLLSENDFKASFFSPEHMPHELHQTRFVSLATGKPYFRELEGVPRVTWGEVEKYIDWANEKLYTTSPENGKYATWDWVLEKFHEQIYAYGCNIFVVDAFNKVGFSKSGNRLEQIGDILSNLSSFSQLNNVLVILVAHPTKMKKNEQGIYGIPDLYDVSGSADFRNQAHDGCAVYRIFGDEQTPGSTMFVNLKTKYKFQGEMNGKVTYRYHYPSGRYYWENYRYRHYSILEDTDPEPELKLIEEDEIPF